MRDFIDLNTAERQLRNGGIVDAPPPKSLDDYGIGAASTPAQARKLEFVAASSLSDQAPPRPWLVQDMIPDRTVTMLSGDGGVGKSLLALQLAVAVATSADWIGTLPEGGGVIYVSAEDDLDEAHRRLAAITNERGGLGNIDDFHILPLAGQDAVMGAPDRSGRVTATPLWRALSEAVADYRPRLLVLDNLADVFAGNENSRPEARQFIGLLRALAMSQNLAILLLAHPSLSGLSSGSGLSGSTAWNNSVRSRLYFTKLAAEDGQVIDDDLRVLRVIKSNYGPADIEIRLRWDRGSFRLDGQGGGFDRAAQESQAERIFLEMLDKNQRQGREVSDKTGANFAPSFFALQPEAKGLSKAILKSAMERLFTTAKIEVKQYGPPSRRLRKIVKSEKNDDNL